MLDRYFPLYIAIFLITLVITALIEKRLIPRLSKSAKQPIYEDGPNWHMKKSGTPTMGGLAFSISASLTLLVSAVILFLLDLSESAISLLTCCIFSILNALIGIVDDIKKLQHKKNEGLTPKQKLFFQFLASAFFLFLRAILLNDNGEISFSFGSVDLGFFYYPISILILLGITNCANLTDGIDGLASSVAFSIAISLFYLSAALNIESCAIASAIIGASIGFLLFNLHPAKIFMGDTGSLFFGSILASAAFALKNPLIIIFIGGVYAIEGISVILQVVFYKITKKRIFKMAPLHHHLEKCGWSENRICIVAILTTFIMSVPAYIFYLP